LVAGGTQDQVRQYEGLAHELGLADNCLFTGTVAPAIAKKYIGQAAVLVSCRVSGSNTPLKIYEQLASGIPLVATAIYSHTQVLDDKVAILVQPNPEAMARGLLRALGDEGKPIAAHARQLYERDYSRQAYMTKMNNLFNLLKKCAA
jgi:glycosyltransferase involved in cell wall biosynthesis